MVAVINDPDLQRRLIAHRRRTGADRYDEVWEGVYMMAPEANLEHQDLATGIATVIRIVVQWPGHGSVYQGVNVSDRREGWKQNYRVPDVAAFLNGTTAVKCKTVWVGGPDFAVGIISPFDRTREKLDFYAKVGTRELLVIDRQPWTLELYRLQHGALVEVGRSTLERPDRLASQAVPLSWQLIEGSERPQIEILHSDGAQHWVV